jgi:hypothetical protein
MFNAPQQSLQANRNGGMATIHETKFYLVGGELPRCRRRLMQCDNSLLTVYA